MEDSESPRPFRRERNLSNRNFAKRSSRRRFSTESHSSAESSSITTESHNASTSVSQCESTSSSSLQYSYSVNSESEAAFNEKSLLKMQPPEDTEGTVMAPREDPVLLDVKQKVLRFETLRSEDQIIFKTGKYNSKALQRNVISNRVGKSGPLRVLPGVGKRSNAPGTPQSPEHSTSMSFHTSIDEERSEDDVDEFSDYSDEAGTETTGKTTTSSGEYVVPEEAQELQESMSPSPIPGFADQVDTLNKDALEYSIDDFGKVESVRRNTSTNGHALNSDGISILSHSGSGVALPAPNNDGNITKGGKDFPRNYRSTPRPKTEIIGIKNRRVVDKHKSLYHSKDDQDDEDEIELRDKSDKVIQPILEELIKTEESYVENLFLGIENYGHIFQRKDLPIGLRGKKYVLFGNIEQIAEFHRDEFLPMLHRNRRDLKRLFEEFQRFIDENCFYSYVIFTMNKQSSLKLCDVYKNYFKLIQSELDDKLGINSFLVQPIQRMARYPLLLTQFITVLFKNRDFVMKPLIEACCRLDKKVRTLLVTTNESEVINDIEGCHEFNVFYQGRFRKVSDFKVFDHTLQRSYRAKVFIFDKCIIYTEIKGKSLIFHGRYPCEHIGVLSKTKSFTLFYEQRKQQECDFSGDPLLIEMWLDLIREMISSYATAERLQERYSKDTEHLQTKLTSLSLFRDSNRFSSDSGIGNIWVMPKPEIDVEGAASGNRTTWYAIS